MKILRWVLQKVRMKFVGKETISYLRFSEIQQVKKELGYMTTEDLARCYWVYKRGNMKTCAKIAQIELNRRRRESRSSYDYRTM